MFHEFELDYKAAKALENIFGAKRESTVGRWFKKFLSGYKSLDVQVRSGMPQSVDSEAVLQAREVIPVSCTRRYQASKVFHSPVWCVIFTVTENLSETAELPHVLPKYYKTFDSPRNNIVN